ncbi:MAG: hypothetical protein ACR2LL_13200 [Nitrosopumilus sp.]|uniref:hypothetical protein n=1 Tax=Nitrosopumilus sp. TaxID=2024843 RepID=UPI002930B6C9|nr:hypothetical protein [Nitrosopumilus sp.]
MPGKGYSTVGLKPTIITKLQDVTERNYPGMFLPSTLIIMMNEVKRGYYSVDTHNIRLDLSGHYNTITIRSDVQQWLAENHEKLGEEYEQKYRVKCFTKFVSYFIINLLESKFNAQKHSINLKESDFEWLKSEYQKQKTSLGDFQEIPTFERFADAYINSLFGKLKTAKEILTF